MSPQDMREVLLARTIAVIANEGLDKTTTKAIVTGTGINEAYIYRHFSDKEDLLSKAFDKLDKELVEKVLQHVPVMYMRELEYEMRCRVFFESVWKFLLGDREKCLTFVRYYYSPYFQKHSASVHRQRYEPVVGKFKDAFIDEVDVWMILNHILNVMLDSAVKVHNDHSLKSDDYDEHIFRIVYQSVRQYFRKNEVDEPLDIVLCGVNMKGEK